MRRPLALCADESSHASSDGPGHVMTAKCREAALTSNPADESHASARRT